MDIAASGPRRDCLLARISGGDSACSNIHRSLRQILPSHSGAKSCFYGGGNGSARRKFNTTCPRGETSAMLTSCSADAARGLLDKVEFFCSRPDFTDSVSGFASQHACAFAGGPIEGEHPVSTPHSCHHAQLPARRYPTRRGTLHPTAPHSFDGTSSTCSTQRSSRASSRPSSGSRVCRWPRCSRQRRATTRARIPASTTS